MLFVVGDYLFDSTLNGVLDSADCVAEWITEEAAEQEPSVKVAIMSSATHQPQSATQSA